MPETYELISSTTLSSSTSSVTFSNIPSTYTDLIAVCNWTASGGSVYMQCRVNSDTGSNYSRTVMAGTSSAVSFRGTSESWAYVTSYAYLQDSEWGSTTINFNDYSNTTTYKNLITRGNSVSIATEAVSNSWRSTAAINTILLQTSSNNFGVGSTFSLYGIKAA